MKKLIVALTLSLGFMLGVPLVAFASPVTHSATTDSAMCIFEAGVTQICQSTNPHIVLNVHNSGDTSQCIFAIQVNWGDGSPVQDFRVPGGPDGSEYLSDHTYSGAPGTYQIAATGSVASGPCYFNPANYQFILSSSPCSTGTPAVGTTGTTPDYCVPLDWNTQYVDTLTPGVEPLNVIISARSTVTLGNILAALNKWYGWEMVSTGKLPSGCLSPETAEVNGHFVTRQEASWRWWGCPLGNILSLFGAENHARLWNQPVPGSDFGAWFITASYETACISLHDQLKPELSLDGHFRTGIPWHCIDGGPGSYGTNGYDNGAANLAASLVQAAHNNGWYAAMRSDARPAGTGEDGVSFSGTVYVVTVDYTAPAA